MPYPNPASRCDETASAAHEETWAVVQRIVALVLALAFVIGTPPIANGETSRRRCACCCCLQVATPRSTADQAIRESCACCAKPDAPLPAPQRDAVSVKVPEPRIDVWIGSDVVNFGVVPRLVTAERRTYELTHLSKLERRRHAAFCLLLR